MMQDAFATSAAATETEEKRRESRRPVSAKCDLRLFHDLGLRTTSAKGEIRNISFRGMSIVAEFPAPIRAGRPVEVLVNISGLAKKYVAGTVAYCRKADRDSYELGLDVKAAGAAPILTCDVTAAQVIYDWFATALKVPE
jgi:hypothetical protein